MLNLPSPDIDPACRRAWPWERFSAVFAPPSELLQNGWFRGRWTTARLDEPSTPGGWSRVEREWNDAGMLASIHVFHGLHSTPIRTIALDYDRAGRLVEVFDVDGPRRFRLGFQYNASGQVIRESALVLDGDDGGPRVGMAESFQDIAGRVRRVLVRDRAGSLRECRLHNADGSRIQTRLYDVAGRLEAKESYFYDKARRMAVLNEVRFDLRSSAGLSRAESRRTDVTWHDERGGLLRREVLDKRNRAVAGAPASWNLVAGEVVHYAGTAERPVSDVSCFFDQWQEAGNAEIVFQIAIDYQYDEDFRLIRATTTEHDMLLGTIVPHVTLYEHRTTGAPAMPNSLGDNDRHPDRRILHEYGPQGHLSRRCVLEGSPLLETQTVVYE
jgi:YD repeat-containing protein